MKVDQFFLIVDDQRRDFSFWFHSFFATFLYENEALGLEQAAVVTMAKRVLQPLKRAFLCIPPECLTTCKIEGGLKMFISQDVWFLQRLVNAYNRHFLAIYRTWHPRMYCWLSCFQRFPVMLCSVCLHDECGIWTTVVMLYFRFQH